MQFCNAVLLLHTAKHDCNAEILGTESYETNTWLWAWANTGSNLPAALIQASLHMKQLGEQQRIAELTEPQLRLSEDVNGHVLAMIASGVCEADAYYRGPYEGGAVFLLIMDAAFPRCRESPLARLGHVFPQAIAAFAIADHRLALTSYLDQADGHHAGVFAMRCSKRSAERMARSSSIFLVTAISAGWT